jgi:hypothetical protein
MGGRDGDSACRFRKRIGEKFMPGSNGNIAERYWRPSWTDSAKNVGWRWYLFLLPIGLCIAMWLERLTTGSAGGGGLFVLLYLLWAISGAAIGRAWHATIKNRAEPFCIHCGYDLTGLVDGGKCPECGKLFSQALIDEYRRDRMKFIETHSRNPSGGIHRVANG